jgi:hypothetical protein
MKRRITESHDLEFDIVYVNATDSITVKFGHKESKDVEKFELKVYEDMLKQNAYAPDDFWIDDAWVAKGNVPDGIDWKEFLGDTRLDQDKVDLIFGDPDVAVKLQFLKDAGYGGKDDIEGMLEEVYVTDADDMKEGNFKQFYPYSWLEEQSENFYPALVKELGKANAESYFDWARVFSDNEVNGDFTSGVIGKHFVWMYRN